MKYSTLSVSVKKPKKPAGISSRPLMAAIKVSTLPASGCRTAVLIFSIDVDCDSGDRCARTTRAASNNDHSIIRSFAWLPRVARSLAREQTMTDTDTRRHDATNTNHDGVATDENEIDDEDYFDVLLTGGGIEELALVMGDAAVGYVESPCSPPLSPTALRSSSGRIIKRKRLDDDFQVDDKPQKVAYIVAPSAIARRR